MLFLYSLVSLNFFLLRLATWYPGRSWDEDWDKLEDKGLRDKKCVPCNLKELRPMAKDAAHTLMPHGNYFVP
ncbi:hypothetical protein AHAS_Ahas05G0059100 [Arachis hypogaea]